MASGITFQEILNDVRSHSAHKYRAMIDTFKVSRNNCDLMESAFRDGFNTAITHLTHMGVIEVREQSE